MRQLLWLEDFNDRPQDLVPTDPEEEDYKPPEPAQAEPPDPCAEAWKEGFIAGCHQHNQNALAESQSFAIQLTRQLAQLEAKLETLANDSAAVMGSLLMEMLTKALPDDWPESMTSRVEAVTAAIRPLFTLDPKIEIHSDPPAELSVRDLPGLYKALESSPPITWPLGLRWQAEKNPNDILDKLKAAMAAKP